MTSTYEINSSYRVYQQGTDGDWFIDVAIWTSGGTHQVTRYGPLSERGAREYAPILAREQLNMASSMAAFAIETQKRFMNHE